LADSLTFLIFEAIRPGYASEKSRKIRERLFQNGPIVRSVSYSAPLVSITLPCAPINWIALHLQFSIHFALCISSAIMRANPFNPSLTAATLLALKVKLAKGEL
jgi:hypothetical protein